MSDRMVFFVEYHGSPRVYMFDAVVNLDFDGITVILTSERHEARIPAYKIASLRSNRRPVLDLSKPLECPLLGWKHDPHSQETIRHEPAKRRRRVHAAS